jgi:DNA-binding IclR family transcriptional regulator
MANSPSGDSVVDRVVRVLATFDPGHTAQTPSQIGRRAGLPRSTAFRLVNELLSAGLLERDDRGDVRIGMRLWELTTRGSRALALRQAAMPAMEDVHGRIQQHTQLAVMENDEALFIERLSSPTAGANITRVAGRLPLHASSSGLVLLAHAPVGVLERVLERGLSPVTAETITDEQALRRKLAEVRGIGYALAPGFIESVSTGLAVPVFDGSDVVAALSVVLPRSVAAPASAVPDLQHAAAHISEALARQAKSR